MHVKEVSQEELYRVLDLHFERVYQNRSNQPLNFPKSEEAQAKILARKNAEQRYHLRLVAYKGDEPVGWHYGYSTDPETYYMQNSAVLEEHRGHGVYGQLLDAVIAKVGSEGFQVITSTHHSNNAAILIPKLKKGFVISGTVFHERFRFLLEMKYFFNAERRKAYDKNLGLDLNA
ncbi:GNAT family N-acetyltransferase [Bdellovibrio sp. NC01]|uniref:GNAT family N-acetyltransferase n=1 Tax=Bdellovibrio sp. NC01 TaxID=2220073 RepID=UPI001159286A|nr:GNAT family N-acetyltransferase [Bdellovibrio sp. NC01]QDK38630.1 hypothetical protein DOE51_14090 [Bdellovibrio sp. NC01]